MERRRERVGPVNPLAEREYQRRSSVEELEAQRRTWRRRWGLRRLIRETDRLIRESFEETFEAARRNFEDVIERLFPGGSGRLRRVSAPRPRPVLGGIEDGDEGATPTFGAEPASVSDEDQEGRPPRTRQAPWRLTAVHPRMLRASRSR